MKELPKYFVIKRDESNPLWKEYIDWLLKKGMRKDWRNIPMNYFGIDGTIFYEAGINCYSSLESFENPVTLITLEEWDECVNGVEFVECTKGCGELYITGKIYPVNDKGYIRDENGEYDNIVSIHNREGNYNQFKKHVLKENNMEEEVKYMPFEKWQKGDVLEAIESSGGGYIRGNTYVIKDIQKEVILTETDEQGSVTNGWHKKFFKFHSRPNKIMKQNHTITAQQAQSIIDIACSSWKPKLAETWAVSIVQKKNIEIEEDFYKQMRSSCTEPQHKLFDEIFGKDEKEFTSDDLEVGEWMLSDQFHYLKLPQGMYCYESKNYIPLCVIKGKKIKFRFIQWEEV